MPRTCHSTARNCGKTQGFAGVRFMFRDVIVPGEPLGQSELFTVSRRLDSPWRHQSCGRSVEAFDRRSYY